MNEAGNASAPAAGLELASSTGRARRVALPALPSRGLQGAGAPRGVPPAQGSVTSSAALSSWPSARARTGAVPQTAAANRGSGQTKLPWGPKP